MAPSVTVYSSLKTFEIFHRRLTRPLSLKKSYLGLVILICCVQFDILPTQAHTSLWLTPRLPFQMTPQQAMPASSWLCFAVPQKFHSFLTILITFHAPITSFRAQKGSAAFSTYPFMPIFVPNWLSQWTSYLPNSVPSMTVLFHSEWS